MALSEALAAGLRQDFPRLAVAAPKPSGVPTLDNCGECGHAGDWDEGQISGVRFFLCFNVDCRRVWVDV